MTLSKATNKIHAVLFDLDGTLVDTAPDLVAALNLSLNDHGFQSVELSAVREAASHGSLALVKAAVGQSSDEQQYSIQQGLLNHYQVVNGKFSRLFDGVSEFLSHLDDLNIPYGVVTNKPARFTRPLMHALALTDRVKTVISGDSTQFSKPHVAPMLLAAQQINCHPEKILYLGDAERDLIAAQNSAMHGGIALWGYIGPNDSPNDWPHSYSYTHPKMIILE